MLIYFNSHNGERHWFKLIAKLLAKLTEACFHRRQFCWQFKRVLVCASGGVIDANVQFFL